MYIAQLDFRCLGVRYMCTMCILSYLHVHVHVQCMYTPDLYPVYTAQKYRFVPYMYVYRARNCVHERLYDNMRVTEP